LLAALLLSANQVVSVDRLVEVIWGASGSASSVPNLRTHVVALRRLLAEAGAGSDRVLTRSGGYLLVVEPGELDLAVFEELVAQGRQARQQEDHALAARCFGQALELWSGLPLENVTLHGSAEPEVARLAEERLAVIQERFDARLACGEHAEVIGELRGFVVEQPLRESLWALLMLALWRAGRPADALVAYDEVRHRLADELGVDPGPELRRLNQRILSGEETATPEAPRPAAAVRCDLPGDIGDFTGRESELRQLIDSVPTDQARTVVVSAIDGMAGIGKTTLAVHCARRLAESYPDGQLFVDLWAHTSGHQPLTPSAALDRLLRAMDVPGGQVPEELAERAALWRSTLAGRRVLIVLDNAADSAQVRQLLPGAPGCLTLVTSRRRLTDLDSVHLLTLDVLPPADAMALFEQVVGDSRPAEEPEAAGEVLALCGYLPLAIRIAAARLRHRRVWDVAHLRDRLRDHQRRLAELRGDDRSVVAVFALSYQQLTVDQRRLFRLLGLHPGTDIDANAAAALAGEPVHRQEELLEDLFDAHLLQQPSAGRYLLHDLLRAYAAQLAADEDTEADRHAALTRLFGHYAHTASRAMDLIAPAERHRRPVVEATGGPEPGLADDDAARAWLETERVNLIAIAAYGAEHGWPAETTRLSGILGRYLETRAYHDDALALHTNALATARETGDENGAGDALAGIGRVHARWGNAEDALDRLGQALVLYRGTGNRPGQCTALNNIGYMHWAAGRYAPALEYFQQSLAISDESGDTTSQSFALNNLGLVYRRLGRYDDAVAVYRQALVILRADRNRAAEGVVLDNLGYVLGRLGRHTEALEHLREALAMARESGHRPGQSAALNGLGYVHRDAGQIDRAMASYLQALDIAREVGERFLEADALNGLGETSGSAGNPVRARDYHHDALAVAEEIGDRSEQARAHTGWGHALHDLGHPGAAAEHWQEALVTYRDLAAPEADLIQNLLAGNRQSQ
ncbi:MAG TPA: BTAD domain-containing putative transcriptional regulator, partial [Pseudonocardiaceae bacterium]|nr:BTAD domain-containing putative transcriptional regulator [Pseudonocardiaceae bacterium]